MLRELVRIAKPHRVEFDWPAIVTKHNESFPASIFTCMLAPRIMQKRFASTSHETGMPQGFNLIGRAHPDALVAQALVQSSSVLFVCDRRQNEICPRPADQIVKRHTFFGTFTCRVPFETRPLFEPVPTGSLLGCRHAGDVRAIVIPQCPQGVHGGDDALAGSATREGEADGNGGDVTFTGQAITNLRVERLAVYDRAEAAIVRQVFAGLELDVLRQRVNDVDAQPVNECHALVAAAVLAYPCLKEWR